MEATDSMVLRAWALVLGALADFSETTTESLVHLWHAVNKYSSTIHTYDDVEEELARIEKICGLKMPYEKLQTKNIKTKGDLERFRRRAQKNALYSAFALIANPIINEKMLSEEMIVKVFRKAYSMDEELTLGKQGRLSLEDLQEMLLDEMGIRLFASNGQIALEEINSTDAGA